MLDPQDDLRNDLQVAIDEHVERVRDDAFRGVLDGHHAVVRPVFADLMENVRDGLVRIIAQAGAKAADRGLMREGGLRSQIGDAHRLLQRQRARHDFAVNRANGLVGDRAFIQPADPLQHRQLAVRRVGLLAGFEFDGADLQDALRALVQEFDDLRIQFVDRLAVVGDVHFGLF